MGGGGGGAGSGEGGDEIDISLFTNNELKKNSLKFSRCAKCDEAG